MVIDPASISPKEVYNILTGAVVPRPLALVTSLSAKGELNIAPYSFFTALSSSPPLILISASRQGGEMKHTAENILLRKEFVVNIVNKSLARVLTHSPEELGQDISAMRRMDLSLAASESIAVPRVAESPVSLECVLYRHLNVGEEPADLIIGEVRRFHVEKSLLSPDGIDQRGLMPVGLMGGNYYAVVERLSKRRKRPTGERVSGVKRKLKRSR